MITHTYAHTDTSALTHGGGTKQQGESQGRAEGDGQPSTKLIYITLRIQDKR